MTIPVILATRAPKQMGCKTKGIDTPIPPENKNAPANNNPVIEDSLKLACDSHIPR